MHAVYGSLEEISGAPLMFKYALQVGGFVFNHGNYMINSWVVHLIAIDFMAEIKMQTRS